MPASMDYTARNKLLFLVLLCGLVSSCIVVAESGSSISDEKPLNELLESGDIATRVAAARVVRAHPSPWDINNEEMLMQADRVLAQALAGSSSRVDRQAIAQLFDRRLVDDASTLYFLLESLANPMNQAPEVRMPIDRVLQRLQIGSHIKDLDWLLADQFIDFFNSNDPKVRAAAVRVLELSAPLEPEIAERLKGIASEQGMSADTGFLIKKVTDAIKKKRESSDWDISEPHASSERATGKLGLSCEVLYVAAKEIVRGSARIAGVAVKRLRPIMGLLIVADYAALTVASKSYDMSMSHHTNDVLAKTLSSYDNAEALSRDLIYAGYDARKRFTHSDGTLLTNNIEQFLRGVDRNSHGALRRAMAAHGINWELATDPSTMQNYFDANSVLDRRFRLDVALAEAIRLSYLEYLRQSASREARGLPSKSNVTIVGDIFPFAQAYSRK